MLGTWTLVQLRNSTRCLRERPNQAIPPFFLVFSFTQDYRNCDRKLPSHYQTLKEFHVHCAPTYCSLPCSCLVEHVRSRSSLVLELTNPVCWAVELALYLFRVTSSTSLPLLLWEQRTDIMFTTSTIYTSQICTQQICAYLRSTASLQSPISHHQHSHNNTTITTTYTNRFTRHH